MGVRQLAEWVIGALAMCTVLLLGSLQIGGEDLSSPGAELAVDGFEVPVSTAVERGVIAFSSETSGNSEIYLQPRDGGEPIQLTEDNDFDSWRPRFSPDRQTLLFYRSPVGVVDRDATQAGLWLMSADGNDLVQVLAPGAHGWQAHGHAEWSPFGNELAMTAMQDDRFRVVVTSVNGVDVRTVANGPGDSLDPSWSPDGSRIIFAGCESLPCFDEQQEIFAVKAAGGERLQITSDDYADRQPRFSPDGRQIVMRSFIADQPDAGWDIRITPTSRVRPPRALGDSPGDRSAPTWLNNETLLFHQQVGNATNLVAADVSSAALRPVLGDDVGQQHYPAP